MIINVIKCRYYLKNETMDLNFSLRYSNIVYIHNRKGRKMKRLLRISFNQAIFSIIPVISWMLLGIIVDKNLSNIFALTYPLQFISQMFKSIFATGANINKEKDKNENAVLSSMTIRNNYWDSCIWIYCLKYKKLY